MGRNTSDDTICEMDGDACRYSRSTGGGRRYVKCDGDLWYNDAIYHSAGAYRLWIWRLLDRHKW